MDAAATVIQAFVSSRLDYCNSVLNSITENLFQRPQSVQNAAARLITQTGRREHITPTPVSRQLHWLPVRRRVEFKLAVLVYKTLHGLAPTYLSDDCLLVAEVGYICDRLMHGHVLYRGPGPSLVT